MRRHLLPLLAFAALAAPAAAQPVDSAYTELDLGQCTLTSADEYGGAAWACPGYRGVPVHVAEGDLRFFVSYGFGAPGELAARQTMPGFNRIHTTLEWRLHRIGDEWLPFATILRWFEDGIEGRPERQTLVVTRLAPGDTCHVAYIDAGRTPNANALARQLADSLARTFACARDQPVLVPG